MRSIAVLALVSFLGCGSETVSTSIDSETPDAPSTANNATCAKVDGYVEFNESVTILVDGGTCAVSYTIHRGVNTFNCDCASDLACAAASLRLQPDGKACFDSF